MNTAFSLGDEILKRKKLNEEIIIENAIKGDKECFGFLIKQEKSYLYKMAYLYVKNEEDALEIVQEVAYRGFLNINKLNKAEFFKTWITKILINVASDYIKLKNKTVFIEEKNIKGISESSNLEEKIDLYNAIDILKEDYKTVIIMKYFSDLKIKDIANVMEIPEGTVKTYLTRAKKDLKNILREGYLNE